MIDDFNNEAAMEEYDKFNKNFFDIRKHKPKKGQILATWTSVAYFMNGCDKRNVINILQENKVGAETAQKIMRNMFGALEADSIRVLLEMAQDLASGMSVDEVAEKEYKMIVQYHYWTKRENVPTDDPHWSTTNIMNTEDIDDKIKFTYTIPD